MKLRGWFKWSLMIFAAACLTISVGLILKAADRNLRAPASGSNPASDPNAAQTRTSALDLSSAPSKSSASAADPQKSNRVLLNVPHLPQGEQYPSGCESVSAVMALRYLGAQITADEFIDGYLDRGILTVSNGVTYGPSPVECFIGSPYSSKSYGCYAPVIADAVQKLEGRTGIRAEAVSGRELSALAEENIKNGRPLLIWATKGMKASGEGTSWRINGTNELFIWKLGEHCLVLIGYDDEHYYFNDPDSSSGGTAYLRTLVERRYRELGSQAVIFPK